MIGPISYLFNIIAQIKIDLLGNPETAMLGIIIANVWRTFPYAMILLLAALQTIPDELYEAGKIDGANSWKLFWKITFPLIRNTLMITVIMLSISYFNMIELPFIMTGGGPN